MAHVDLLIQFRAVDDRVALLVINDRTVKGVHVADEFAHHPTDRRFIDVDRATDLSNPAQVHDGDTLSHGHGFFLVMGHHHTGHANPLDDLHQFQLHLRAQFFVQRAHRLIEQQQFRALGQRTGQGHALTLTTGQLVRLAFGVLGHVHQSQHFLNASLNVTGGQTVLLQAKGDVLRHRHVREQRVRLKHHIDRPLVGRHVSDVYTVEENTALCWALKACQHAQEGRLSGAGASEQGEDFTLMDLQGHIVNSDGFVELLGDTVDFYQHFLRCLVTFKSLPIGTGGVCHMKLPTGFSRQANAARLSSG